MSLWIRPALTKLSRDQSLVGSFRWSPKQLGKREKFLKRNLTVHGHKSSLGVEPLQTIHQCLPSITSTKDVDRSPSGRT